MRITGGTLCGRRIEVPAKGVRPTKDRVRESLFAILGESLRGARVLDLYAGSGSLGLEAISRGAAAVCWVERDRPTFAILKKNVQSLCRNLEGVDAECALADAMRFIARPAPLPYNFIFADPPYDKGKRGDKLKNILVELDNSKLLAQGGFIVYEMSSVESAEMPANWNILRDRKWGETRALIMQREE